MQKARQPISYLEHPRLALVVAPQIQRETKSPETGSIKILLVNDDIKIYVSYVASLATKVWKLD